MKAIIFGATGGTGLELVSQCLAAGHSTSAFVRTPSKLKGLTPSIITGDVKNAAQVEAALEPERMSGGAREWAVCDAAGGDALVAGVTWLAQAIRRGGSGGAPEA